MYVCDTWIKFQFEPLLFYWKHVKYWKSRFTDLGFRWSLYKINFASASSVIKKKKRRKRERKSLVKTTNQISLSSGSDMKTQRSPLMFARKFNEQ